MSHWNDLKQSSNLARQAQDEIKELIKKNRLEMDWADKMRLQELKMQELQAQAEARDREAQLREQEYRNQLKNILDEKQRQAIRQPTPYLGGYSSNPKWDNDEIEKLKKLIMGGYEEEKKPKKKKKPKPIKGLSDLLKGVESEERKS